MGPRTDGPATIKKGSQSGRGEAMRRSPACFLGHELSWSKKEEEWPECTVSALIPNTHPRDMLYEKRGLTCSYRQ